MYNSKGIRLSEEYAKFAEHFTECNTRHPEAFHLGIHPEDDMFHKAILPGYSDAGKAYLAYLESGRRSMDIVRQAVNHFFSDFEHVGQFLEFACGYGRLTRFLIQELPRERLRTSDILTGAVAWQEQYLGVNSIASSANPKDFECREKFSVVFVGSLFSHLPDHLFKAWLRKLCGLVAESGILVFSVHDKSILPSGIQPGESGMQFLRESETDLLPHDLYGLSYVSEEYVSAAIDDATDGTHHYVRIQKGLYENQDLYIVADRSIVDLSELDLKITPIGGTVGCRIDSEDTILIKGWAIDLNRGEQITEADLFVNDHLIESTEPVANREDVVAEYFPGAPNVAVSWSFRVPARNLGAHDLVTCRLRNQSNVQFHVYVPTSDAFG